VDAGPAGLNFAFSMRWNIYSFLALAAYLREAGATFVQRSATWEEPS
jgi:hypothetical protein